MKILEKIPGLTNINAQFITVEDISVAQQIKSLDEPFEDSNAIIFLKPYKQIWCGGSLYSDNSLKYEVIENPSSEIDIYPGKMYVIKNISSNVKFNLISDSSSSTDIFSLRLHITGDDVSVSFPDNVIFKPSSIEVKNNKTYEISIIDNYGLYVEF